jgi:tRNA threonylcarbamoyladenosine biosynthesis protein TsaB
MLLLALDTCDANGSVAVLDNDEVLQAVAHDTAEDYSSWLLPAVQEILQAAGVALQDVDAYAVAAGPGSFTGVRVGLTTAKAWAELFGHGIAAVSRLEALATQASGAESFVAAFADARRGQVFGAMYRRGSKLDRVGEEMVIAPEKFVAWAAEEAGGERIQWISTDATCLTETAAWTERRGIGESIQTASSLLAPVIGRLGYRLALENRLTSAFTLDANYVRRSDAEIFWKDGGAKTAGER